MGTKLDWRKKVKIWEEHYLRATPIDKIRMNFDATRHGRVPSWYTVKQVTKEFPTLSRAQVHQLSDALQERWQELQSEAEQQSTKELRVEYRPQEDMTNEQQTKEEVVALVYRWQDEVASYSPVNLLQGWLDKADDHASHLFYANKYVEALCSKCGGQYARRLQLRPYFQVEHDPTFGLLLQKFPASHVWAALHDWRKQMSPYVQAYYHMLRRMEYVVAYAVDALCAEADKEDMRGADWIAAGNPSGLAKRYKIERLLTVSVACDLLACSIAEFPSSPYWARLRNGLEKLRLRVNLQVVEVVGIAPTADWTSAILEARAELPDRPLELTQRFLDELAKLHLTEESLVKALNELETETRRQTLKMQNG